MVDVGDKPVTKRTARASGVVRMQSATLDLIRDRAVAKGDVLEVARLAAIMSAKKTDQIIPLCHSLPLSGVEVEFAFTDNSSITIGVTVRTEARTGVEMEALVAVSTAALTIYDMCKSVDRAMSIDSVQLDEKEGGRSGHYQRKDSQDSPQE